MEGIYGQLPQPPLLSFNQKEVYTPSLGYFIPLFTPKVKKTGLLLRFNSLAGGDESKLRCVVSLFLSLSVRSVRPSRCQLRSPNPPLQYLSLRCPSDCQHGHLTNFSETHHKTQRAGPPSDPQADRVIVVIISCCCCFFFWYYYLF